VAARDAGQEVDDAAEDVVEVRRGGDQLDDGRQGLVVAWVALGAHTRHHGA
jgi:hypothetical protein